MVKSSVMHLEFVLSCVQR